MKIEVRYFSRSGNTGKIACAIAEAAGVTAKIISEKLEGDVDLLFIGGAMYAFSIDARLKNFINGLDASKIKKAAVFGTSAGIQSVPANIKKLLTAKGITVIDETFYCASEFTLVNKGKPDDKDLQDAKDFAARCLKAD
ncbi:MAG: hypothetical protein Ta2F_00650 [Termitinemataceae bacterium]|nr:MAG: hypothetical protein Ta2F_00650 [Termitinemataceae bacterium]